MYSKQVYGLGLGRRSRPSAMTRIPGKSFSPQYPKLLNGPLNFCKKNFQAPIYTWWSYTVKSLFVAAATISFDEIFRQNVLSRNCFLLRPLFKGGYYSRAATNKDFTVYCQKTSSFVEEPEYFLEWSWKLQDSIQRFFVVSI